MDDPVFLVYHLFRDGRELPCPAAADTDGSGCIDLGDVIHSLRFLFVGDVYMTKTFPAYDCDLIVD